MIKLPCYLVLLLVVFSFFPNQSCHSQGTTSNWYFGRYAGLNFNTNPPTATTGLLSTHEGCSSISDDLGNLLFYTNGDSVYTKQHQIMVNGTQLGGSYSTSQSAVIIKKPGSTNLFYIFTIDNCGGPDGLSYSIVDMNLQSGMGQVITKNVLLYKPTSEKLAAVHHCNGTDFWIVTHKIQSDTFVAHLLTSAGVSTTSVKTAIGTVHNQNCGAGSIKISPNRNKLATSTQNGFVELFDFDNSTGVLSNLLTIHNSTAVPSGFQYSCEFSPDGSKLYSLLADSPPYPCIILQWDLCVGSPLAIIASQYTVAQYLQAGSLQRAPNGAIYIPVNSQTYLSAIYNPNMYGAACNFSMNAVSIAPHTCVFGVPNFVADDIPAPTQFSPVNSGPNASCRNLSFGLPGVASPTILNCTARPGFSVSNVHWDFDDPSSASANTSTLNSPNHIFISPGTHTVMLVVNYSSCVPDTFYTVVNIPQLTLTSNTLMSCTAGATSSISIPANYTYTWSSGNYTTPAISGLAAGIYTLVATNIDLGCTLSETVQLVTNTPTMLISGNFSICAGNTATLNVQGNGTYSWSTGATSSVITIAPLNTTNYTVIASNLGCTSSSIVSILVNAPPTLSISGNFSICAGEKSVIKALGASSFSWSSGSTFNTVTVTPQTSTIYTLIASNQYCSTTETIAVTVYKCTGLVELTGNTTIKVYPNPTHSVLYLEINEETTVTISDILGKVIFRKSFASGKQEIDVHDFPNGMYLLKFDSDSGSGLSRFVKH